VSCGVLMYSRKDASGKLKVMHVEGDPDNPVNKGTLCPKGAGILDMVESPNRLQFPEVREPGSNAWKRISWDEALTRITKRMKADRDQNFVAKKCSRRDREPLEHLRDAGELGFEQRSGLSQRQDLAFNGRCCTRYTSAYLTRPDGSQSGSDVWARCDDQPLG